MKKVFTVLFILSYFNLSSQELISNDLMKGHVQDGKRVSVWEYYDGSGDLVIKIDYNTGNIFYLKKDTTDFVIKKGGNWIKQKLTIYPTPIEGFYNFRRSLAEQVIYPDEARERGIRGKVYVIFEVDTTGSATNFKIINDIGGGCGNALLSGLQNMQTVWLSAQENGKIYTSRFIASAVFNFQNEDPIDTTVNYPVAKEIPEIGITAFGYNRPNKISFYSIEDALKFKNTALKLSIVDKNLSKIPKEIGLLKRLTFLDLEKNSITELPIEIFMIKQLEELYLPNNKLKEIPAEVSSYKYLRMLGLDSNEFSYFPISLCDLKKLEALDLGNNNIKEIPSCINNLKYLKVLILQENDISELPEEIFELKNLQVINLKGNSFSKDKINIIKSSFSKKVKVIID
ncbi:MAG: energy transducer TonB [Bacteroidales bacterium]|nr:energy transducer TonB [Bacteroidales bacterium]